MSTKNLHRILFVIAPVAIGGCGFRSFVREARDPALAAEAPCYAGDVCASAPHGGFGWTAEVMHSAGR